MVEAARRAAWLTGRNRAIGNWAWTGRSTRRDFLNGVAVAAGTSRAAASIPAGSAEAVAAEPGPAGLLSARAHRHARQPSWLLRGRPPPCATATSSTAASDARRPASTTIWWSSAAASAASRPPTSIAQARPIARILILDNHDDFGGHAKRNEFHLDGKLQLLNGGTLEIDSPRPYSAVAAGTAEAPGVDPAALAEGLRQAGALQSLGLRHAVFFDQETFGADRLVAGTRRHLVGRQRPGRHAARRRKRVASRHRAHRRPADARLPAGPDARTRRRTASSRISYRDYLADVVKADPGAVAVLPEPHPWRVGRRHRRGLGAGLLGPSAFPGFQGLKLEPGPAPRMGYTAGRLRGRAAPTPSISRTGTRPSPGCWCATCPAALPGHDCRDVVTARADYGRLDRPGTPCASALQHRACAPATSATRPRRSDGVAVAYARGDEV